MLIFSCFFSKNTWEVPHGILTSPHWSCFFDPSRSSMSCCRFPPSCIEWTSYCYHFWFSTPIIIRPFFVTLNVSFLLINKFAFIRCCKMKSKPSSDIFFKCYFITVLARNGFEPKLIYFSKSLSKNPITFFMFIDVSSFCIPLTNTFIVSSKIVLP